MATNRTPAEPARRPRPKRRLPPEVLTDAEVRRLMDACGGGPVGIRNRALLALMYRTGVRVSEALALEPKDLDLENGTVRVLSGKGGRSRVVGLDPGGAAVVAAWAVERDRILASGGGATGRVPLFCTGAWHRHVPLSAPSSGTTLPPDSSGPGKHQSRRGRRFWWHGRVSPHRATVGPVFRGQQCPPILRGPAGTRVGADAASGG
ncbi:MAG: tyrosine-type recombinase/integrase, partial [Planctomycetes bacterium]|nr:tyrosine-type recombinase/integrase [Planctomycetota bacterium]